FREWSTLDFVRGVKDNMEIDMPEITSVPAGLCDKTLRSTNDKHKKPDGKSGGIIALWDSSYFKVSASTEAFIVLLPEQRSSNGPAW
nr:hypothetical protein [Tanacetum cinerariifolium]